MNKTIIITLMVIFSGPVFLFANPADQSQAIVLHNSIYTGDSVEILKGLKELRIASSGSDINAEKKKKLISAMLAFPFPFGFMGAHRVMLGCKPWVPVVYMATFGGCFGVLPMIDFCAILLSKDITRFENNPHVFMWVK